jgi:hypothetical protein
MQRHIWFVPLGCYLLLISAAPVSAAPMLLPAGTVVNVQTTQAIYADYAQPGTRVGGVVTRPVTVGGRVVIPRGSPATLEVANVERSSNLKGRDRIYLRVRSIRVADRFYAVSTNYVQLRGPSEGKRAARKGIAGGAIGGLLGGLVGGGAGAAIGATAGAGTGVAIAGSGKSHLAVPARTPLQFQLTGTIRIGR